MSIISTLRTLRALVLTFLYFLALQVGFGQSVPTADSTTSLKKPLVRVSTQDGTFLRKRGPFYTSIDEDGDVFKNSKSVSLEYGWQMMGGKDWHQTSRFPRMGFGIQYLRVTNRDELGHPVSVYGYYDGIFFRLSNLEATNRVSLGLSYGFDPYDPDDELPNDIIGSKLNGFVELGFGFGINLNKYLHFEPGFRFSHFSNGNTRKPQQGVNIISYSVGLRHLINPQHIKFAKSSVNKCQNRHEILVFLAMASRQLDFNENKSEYYHETYGLNYLMASIHLGYNYEVNHRLKLGSGVDLIYDGTNGQKEIALTRIPSKRDIPFNDKLGISVFIGGERVIDKISIIGSLGYIVAQTRFIGSSPAFEQRLGIKYHLTNNIFAGINVRAYRFRIAKTLELNIGIRKFLK